MSIANPLEDILRISVPAGYKQKADLDKSQLENKFMPLDRAIKAQNALAYGSKQSGIGTFLRGISQLPVAERQIYLSDPTNRKNYLNMLEQFRQGNNSPAQGGNILTPELLSGFGLTGGSGNNQSPNSLLESIFGGNNQQPVNQIDQGGQQVQQQPQQQPQQSMGNNPNDGSMPSNEQLVQNNDQQEPQAIPGVPVSPKLSTKERQLYTSQVLANNHAIGSEIKNRADNAVAFEKTMHLLQPKLQELVNNAVKYSGVYGRGKGWLDKFKNDQPKEYQDFISMRDSLIPLLGNGVAYVDRMGQSHEAHQEAQGIVSALNKLDVSPDTALKVFNDSMGYLDEVTQGVLDSAEPVYPGVRRKLAGVPTRTGDYITNTNKKSSSSAARAAKGHEDFEKLSLDELNGILNE
jgi:hypothetical protein